MEEFIESCFSWPTLPASVLLSCVCFYWVLMTLGALDLDFLDFDVDLDVDADPSVLQFGFIPLDFLNIGSVPTMLWVSVFAITNWTVSRTWNSPLPHASFELSTDTMALLRDAGVAVMLTKIITQPLRGRFDPVQPNQAADLVGKTCVVTTSEVTDSFGEAELRTEGAPLRLNIRNPDGTLKKGDSAIIVDYDTEHGNIYFVDPV